MAFLTCHFFAETLGVSTCMNVLLPQPTGKGQVGMGGAVERAGAQGDWIANPERRPKMEAIWGAGLKGFGTESDLLALASRLKASSQPPPRFYQWCGTEDFLYRGNQRFRDHAEEVGLDLTYSEGPGDHSWPHWDREIQGVLSWLLPQRPK